MKTALSDVITQIKEDAIVLFQTNPLFLSSPSSQSQQHQHHHQQQQQQQQQQRRQQVLTNWETKIKNAPLDVRNWINSEIIQDFFNVSYIEIDTHPSTHKQTDRK
jgi:hypothetical protein